jgi:O-antigen/teichoic acid export membrane protein
VSIILGVITFMLFSKSITVEEFGAAAGTVLTIWLAISKDPDKTQNK